MLGTNENLGLGIAQYLLFLLENCRYEHNTNLVNDAALYKMSALQGYLKTRFFAMGALKSERIYKNLRDSQLINLSSFEPWHRKKEERG